MITLPRTKHSQSHKVTKPLTRVTVPVLTMTRWVRSSLAYIIVPPSNLVFQIKKDVRTPECCLDSLDLHCGNYPHPVPRATTKCPTSLCVRQTPVTPTNNAKRAKHSKMILNFGNPGFSSCSTLSDQLAYSVLVEVPFPPRRSGEYWKVTKSTG